MMRPAGKQLLGIALLAAILMATWVFGLDHFGRDPATGEIQRDFSFRPHIARTLLEPLMGPALQVGLEPSLRQFTILAGLWVLGLLILLSVPSMLGHRAARRGFLALLGASFLWGFIAFPGFGIPDRFEARGRKGVFIDWHLHGGDPEDGRISIPRLGVRETLRGVAWAIITQHSVLPAGEPAPMAHGVFGTEWSGRSHPESRSMHVLILGSRAAVLAADAELDELAAIRAAKMQGALVIVAHYWRQSKTERVVPFESLVAAGVDGFEIGNRHREDEPEQLRALVELDRKVRDAGLLRVSFSDDHGYPAGSRCVTFLEGVDPAELDAGAGPAIVASLRRTGPASVPLPPSDPRLVPLLFDPAAPGRSIPGVLIPPVVGLDYLRQLTPAARAVWLVYGSLLLLWILAPGQE